MFWQRAALPVDVRNRIDSLLDGAVSARDSGDPDTAWRHLEDAHVLSQSWIRPHAQAHLAMLSFGWSLRDRAEIVGQLARLLVAGPGSATGRYSVGNTGRANVSAFEPVPVRDGLARLLDNTGDDAIVTDHPRRGVQ